MGPNAGVGGVHDGFLSFGYHFRMPGADTVDATKPTARGTPTAITMGATIVVTRPGGGDGGRVRVRRTTAAARAGAVPREAGGSS